MTTTAEKTAAAKQAKNAWHSKPMTLSPELTAVIGSGPALRSEAASRVWDYIKAHKLQDEHTSAVIHADERLLPIFGRAQVTAFELPRLIKAHLS